MPGPHLLHPLPKGQPAPSKPDDHALDTEEDGMSRRSFLRTSTVLSAGVAAVAAGLAPLRKLGEFTSVDQFLQKYYKN